MTGIVVELRDWGSRGQSSVKIEENLGCVRLALMRDRVRTPVGDWTYASLDLAGGEAHMVAAALRSIADEIERASS